MGWFVYYIALLAIPVLLGAATLYASMMRPRRPWVVVPLAVLTVAAATASCTLLG